MPDGAIVASAVGLSVALLYFNAWLIIDVAINGGLLHMLLATEWPEASFAGA